MYSVVGSAVMQVWNPLVSERLIPFEKSRRVGSFCSAKRTSQGKEEGGRKLERTVGRDNF